MLPTKEYEFWFVTGSQHLYGEETLQIVDEHAKAICEGLSALYSRYTIKHKPVVTSSQTVRQLLREAEFNENCAGIITWMHTFSPAKMWIEGLTSYRKPLMHLHTQYHRDIPWESIDMDFMNINQSAHGDREYGYMNSRMGQIRKVVVGYWDDEEVKHDMSQWMNTAAALNESRNIKVARFGDNMRHVAVTDGDKVGAHIQFGWQVDGYGIGDLVDVMNGITEDEIEALFNEYDRLYDISEETKQDESKIASIKEQAKIELGLSSFLEKGRYTAFTTSFEVLHGMKQLPGLAVQRLMGKGYGFAGEGDWKTAALVRMMKIMADGKKTSFMEDYTYHFEPGKEMILGSHMLEVCPTVALDKPKIEVHPLSIGAKEDPARMVFNGIGGTAIQASLIDIGGRFRLVLNEVNGQEVEKEMPHLPVARVLWKPEPSLKMAAEAWILAGGAHHTCLSYQLTADQMMDWAEMAGIESILISHDTSIHQLKNELKWNEALYRLQR
ncbi:L-arabinose isomerase [Bacillus atrophaeus]|uniref:L-arabinose isomerase n=1 Tax=Bacillus atrophaeus TaxID=1452 RepID=UPI002DB59D90|nr:L-arabinose isomerase [Bacillus atrophaeus]MEC2306926.1 L-arabinose isomerase [Bacillus atrophaeus]